MRKTLLIACLILAAVLFVSCAGDITKHKLQGRTILLSTPRLELDPLQSQDIYLGINNVYDRDEKFRIDIECTVVDCNEYILAQTFPHIGISAGEMGAFPIRVIAQEDALPGLYPFQLTVMHDDSLYGKAKLTVKITEELEERKEELKKRLR